MPQVTIRPGISNTTLIGAIRCANAAYATARDGTGTLTSIESAASITGGQRLFSGTYDCNEMFFGFTPSAVAGAVVTDVKFEWTTFSSNVTGGLEQAILNYTAGAITTADWQDGTELAALTSYGSIPGTGYQSVTTTYQVSLNAAARTAAQTALRAGSTFSFMVVAQAQVDNSALSGNNRYDIRSEQDATEAYRPALIIDYRLPPVMTYHYLRQMGA